MWKQSQRYQRDLVLCLSMCCMAYWNILPLNLVYGQDILVPYSLLSIKSQVSILQIHSDELVRKEKRIVDWFLTIHWFQKIIMAINSMLYRILNHSVIWYTAFELIDLLPSYSYPVFLIKPHLMPNITNQ